MKKKTQNEGESYTNGIFSGIVFSVLPINRTDMYVSTCNNGLYINPWMPQEINIIRHLELSRFILEITGNWRSL